MGTITVKINKRNLNALVRKNNFHVSGGMFKPYQFIGMDFETDKDNIATFYESTIVTSNSWTNYPGIKIWNNNHDDWTKAQVLEDIENEIVRLLDWASQDYPEINFELIGFEN